MYAWVYPRGVPCEVYPKSVHLGCTLGDGSLPVSGGGKRARILEAALCGLGDVDPRRRRGVICAGTRGRCC